ncbi:low affinity immunoglobulin gamma Fc region receptor III-like [Plectropomus leopardus]|uniref:low affinity immunoglobulin gamma Fc region receptor III-like n=1 Tax=Plectropomus leopardus TaxID=160734 RepID=UPI001C4C4416|nr:low affinity immunoglobulin gamma Fc region receptor III-like [Plectropomus leopardus]
MKVSALGFRLLTNMLLLVAQILKGYAQKHDAAFSRIVPSRLQLFEYESVTFNCESFNGSTGWEVVRRVNGEFTSCAAKWRRYSGSTCAIRNSYQSDSGEYWCRTGAGGRSNGVNVTVTAGSVILESPVLPVMEGDAATLSCRTKADSSNFTADFYKDGLFVGSGSEGEMTIHSVSKSDEGLYKCHIYDCGESPASWLAVRELLGDARPRSDDSCQIYVVLRAAIVAVVVALLLLLLGVLHCWKPRGT